jgi:hypothetical protein
MVLAALALLAAPPAHAFQTKRDDVVTKVTAAEVATMLQAKGHQATERVDSEGDPMLSVKSAAFSYRVLFYGCHEGSCDTVQFRAWWELPGKFSSSDVNAFNREYRVGRAYLDDDSYPTLDVVLELSGGVTPEHLSFVHERFQGAGKEFKAHLSEALEARK